MDVLTVAAACLQLNPDEREAYLLEVIERHSRDVLQCTTRLALDMSRHRPMTPYVPLTAPKMYGSTELEVYYNHLRALGLPLLPRLEWSVTDNYWHTAVTVTEQQSIGRVTNTLTAEQALVEIPVPVIVAGLVDFYGVPYPEDVPFHEYVAARYPQRALYTPERWSMLPVIDQWRAARRYKVKL